MGTDNQTIKSIGDYLKVVREHTKTPGEYVFRGQENSDWKLECGASRRLRGLLDISDAPTTTQLNHYHTGIVEDIKQKNFEQYRDYSDFDIIADLQHYGAATLFLDFTRNSLIALFFSCLSTSKESKDGAVYLINCDFLTRYNEKVFKYTFNTNLGENALENPMSGLFYWEPSHLNKRIPAQDSIFIFGKSVIGEKHYKKIVVDESAKVDILTDLNDLFNINGAKLFNDPTGFALSHSVSSPFDLSNKANEEKRILMLQSNSYFEKALILLNKYVARYPNEGFGYFMRGINFQRTGKLEQSIIEFNKLISAHPEYPYAYSTRGFVRHLRGDFKGAILDFDEGLKRDTNLAETYYNRGSSRYFLGDYARAIEDFTSAINQKSDFADAYNNRGDAKISIGAFDEALIDFKAAVSLKPEIWQYHSSMCELFQIVKNYQGMLDSSEIIIKLNPNTPQGFFFKAFSQYHLLLNDKDAHTKITLDDVKSNLEKAKDLAEKTNSMQVKEEISKFEKELED